MTTMTPEQALNNLYTATRALNTTAENHDAIRQSAEVLGSFIDKHNHGAKNETAQQTKSNKKAKSEG